MQFSHIDHGGAFDFGRTAESYAKYRDIYPEELYVRLHEIGVGEKGKTMLDLGTGTCASCHAGGVRGVLFCSS